MSSSQVENAKNPVAVFLPYRTPEWVDLAASVCESLRNRGIEGTVVDVSEWNYPTYLVSKRTMNQWLDHRANLVYVHRRRVQGESLGNLDSRLSPYIRSAALSAVKDEKSRKLLGFVKHMIRRRLKGLEHELKTELARHNFKGCVIPNGRFPLDQLLLDWARSLGADVNFFEFSLLGNDRAFLAPYPPQDLSELTTDFRNFSLRNKDRQFNSANWILERMESAKSFDVESKVRSQIVFFTSSSDEYWALSSEWHTATWSSQFEGFSHVVGRLDPSGNNSVVRVHPNSLTKSPFQRAREARQINKLSKMFPGLTTYRAKEKVNSYSLAAQAEIVVTPLSTIGLESALLGKRIFFLHSSQYSEAIASQKIFSSQDEPIVRDHSEEEIIASADDYLQFLNSRTILHLPKTRSTFLGKLESAIYALMSPANFFLRLLHLSYRLI